MTPRLLVLILVSVALSALAQLALKIGTARAARGGGGGVAEEAIGFAQSPLVAAGLALYALGALIWLFVLARAPLSLAYPFVGLGFVLTMLAGMLALGETPSAERIGGTLLIALGCVLVARSG